jgi:hypothetical protein
LSRGGSCFHYQTRHCKFLHQLLKHSRQEARSSCGRHAPHSYCQRWRRYRKPDHRFRHCSMKSSFRLNRRWPLPRQAPFHSPEERPAQSGQSPGSQYSRNGQRRDHTVPHYSDKCKNSPLDKSRLRQGAPFLCSEEWHCVDSGLCSSAPSRSR